MSDPEFQVGDTVAFQSGRHAYKITVVSDYWMYLDSLTGSSGTILWDREYYRIHHIDFKPKEE